MSTLPTSNANARASVVNRVHRIIREEALDMRERKERKRALWVPLGISSVLLMVVCYAVWAMLDGYDLTPNGVPDASDQIVLMFLWFLPITALVIGTVWIRRTRLGSHEVSR